MKSHNIERPLALALWNDFCREIERECRGVNSVEGRRMIFEIKRIDILVPRVNARILLGLSYQKTSPFIDEKVWKTFQRIVLSTS